MTDGFKPALFLDRDGVLNELVPHDIGLSAPWKIEELKIIEAARDVVETGRALGAVPIIVTNQPDVAHGWMTRASLEQINSRIKEYFGIDALEMAESPDNADPRRKPNPGMLLDARDRYGVDLTRSIFIGDTWRDMEAGKRAGVRTVLRAMEYNEDARELADVVCGDYQKITAEVKRFFTLEGPAPAGPR